MGEPRNMVMVYAGVEITFEEYGHRFSLIADAEGETAEDRESPEKVYFPSWAEATAEIDRIQGLQTKRQRAKTAIEVLTDTGVVATVTGVHATRGTLNGLPDRYSAIYPVTDRVRTLLIERNAIQTRLREAEHQLRRYALDRSRKSYNTRSITPQYVDDVLEALRKDIEVKSALPEEPETNNQ